MLVLANKRSVFAPPLQTPNSAVQNNPTQSFAQPQIGLTAICTAPEILHNLCFKFLLGITVVPREIEENGCANFWGVNKAHYDL